MRLCSLHAHLHHFTQDFSPERSAPEGRMRKRSLPRPGLPEPPSLRMRPAPSSMPCGTDPDRWDFDPATPPADAGAFAKAGCRICPATVECLRAGLSQPRGIWGGLTPAEREALGVGRVDLDELLQASRLRTELASSRTRESIAQSWGVSPRTVYRWAAQDALLCGNRNELTFTDNMIRFDHQSQHNQNRKDTA